MTFSLEDVANFNEVTDSGRLDARGVALLKEWLDGCSLNSGVVTVEVLDQRTYRNGATQYVDIKVTYTGQKKAKTTRIYPAAVNILATLRCEGVTYLALVEQFRSAIGADVIGNPGGRTELEHTVIETARRELDEELGLSNVTWGNPVDLTKSLLGKPTQGSPGTAREEINVVHIDATITSEQLAEFNGHQAGLIAEGERTKVRLVPIDELDEHLRSFHGAISMKMLGALWLYEMARQRVSSPSAARFCDKPIAVIRDGLCHCQVACSNYIWLSHKD